MTKTSLYISKQIAWFTMIIAVLVMLLLATSSNSARAATFYNPVSDLFDSFITTSGGYYYLMGSESNSLYIRKSSTLGGLSTAPKTLVYTSAGVDLWSPTLYFVQGKWYIYFSEHWNGRLIALENTSPTQDPVGPYAFKAVVRAAVDSNNIGPGIVIKPDGTVYMTNSTPAFHIQQMSNPWTLTGSQVHIESPRLSWEGSDFEGSTVIQHTQGGVTKYFMPYTEENWNAQTDGAPCWSWCVGMYYNTDGNLTNPASWTKLSLPAFTGGPDVGLMRVLALNTFKSPDGTEDWMVWNGMDDATNDWGNRKSFAKKFTWDVNGMPVFGTPTPLNQAITVPSGEVGSPTPLTPGSVLLNDTFANTTNWTVQSGNWALCSGAYCASNTGVNLSLAGQSRWNDYVIKAEAVTTSTPNNSDVGVLARVQDANNYYQFAVYTVNSTTREWRIHKNKGGVYTLLASGPVNWSNNVRHWLRFDVNQWTLTGLISTDGIHYKHLGSVKDSTFSIGKIGLRMWNGTVGNYDNVTVTQNRPSNGFYAGVGFQGFGISPALATTAWTFQPGRDVNGYHPLSVGGPDLATNDYVTAAAVNTSAVVAPAHQTVYQSERYNHLKKITYDFPSLVENQQYLVRLHFAEIFYTSAGQRTFNVSINGTQVLTNFDKVAAAGGANKAIVKEYVATANSAGHIWVQFSPGTIADTNPTISGIEIRPMIHALNSGGSAAGRFTADALFGGGLTLTTATAINTTGVEAAAPASLYQSERYNTGSFSYTLNYLMPWEYYLVRLHFAEIHYTASAQRYFNVLIAGTQVLTNFDKVAAAGGANKAVVKEFLGRADANGNMVIQFTPGTVAGKDGNPTISGIEVVRAP